MVRLGKTILSPEVSACCAGWPVGPVRCAGAREARLRRLPPRFASSRRLLAHAPTLPYNRKRTLESNTVSIESKIKSGGLLFASVQAALFWFLRTLEWCLTDVDCCISAQTSLHLRRDGARHHYSDRRSRFCALRLTSFPISTFRWSRWFGSIPACRRRIWPTASWPIPNAASPPPSTTSSTWSLSRYTDWASSRFFSVRARTYKARSRKSPRSRRPPCAACRPAPRRR